MESVESPAADECKCTAAIIGRSAEGFLCFSLWACALKKSSNLSAIQKHMRGEYLRQVAADGTRVACSTREARSSGDLRYDVTSRDARGPRP